MCISLVCSSFNYENARSKKTKYFIQTYEDRASTENTEKIFNWNTEQLSFFFLSLEKLIIPRKGGRNNEKIKSNGREIDSENRPNTSGLQGHKMQRKESMKTDIHNQKQLKILIRNALRAGNITCK